MTNYGRIVIPAEYRKALGIKENNTLSIFIDNNRLILEKGHEINELGQIVLPLNARQILGIEAKDELNIEIAEGKIILSKKANNKE